MNRKHTDYGRSKIEILSKVEMYFKPKENETDENQCNSWIKMINDKNDSDNFLIDNENLSINEPINTEIDMPIHDDNIENNEIQETNNEEKVNEFPVNDEQQDEDMITKHGRGRPKLIKTGLPGRPKKQYQKANNINAEDDHGTYEKSEFANMAISDDPQRKEIRKRLV